MQNAYAAVVTGQVRLIAALNAEIAVLGEVVAEHFGRHRDAEIYATLPGLGLILGARIVGEFGEQAQILRQDLPGDGGVASREGASRGCQIACVNGSLE